MPILGPNEGAGLKIGKIIFINSQADNQVTYFGNSLLQCALWKKGPKLEFTATIVQG